MHCWFQVRANLLMQCVSMASLLKKGPLKNQPQKWGQIEDLAIKFASFLIKQKININHQDNQGRSALLLASYWNLLKLAKVLIDNGADVN